MRQTGYDIFLSLFVSLETLSSFFIPTKQEAIAMITAAAARIESFTGSLINFIPMRQPLAAHSRISAGARLRSSRHSYLFMVIPCILFKLSEKEKVFLKKYRFTLFYAFLGLLLRIILL